MQFARTGDRDRDVRLGTEQIARVLEAMIRKAPDQWVVLQPVWPDLPSAPAPLATLEPPASPAAAPAELADRPTRSA
jgi:hypothetical protein